MSFKLSEHHSAYIYGEKLAMKYNGISVSEADNIEH